MGYPSGGFLLYVILQYKTQCYLCKYTKYRVATKKREKTLDFATKVWYNIIRKREGKPTETHGNENGGKENEKV